MRLLTHVPKSGTPFGTQMGETVIFGPFSAKLTYMHKATTYPHKNAVIHLLRKRLDKELIELGKNLETELWLKVVWVRLDCEKTQEFQQSCDSLPTVLSHEYFLEDSALTVNAQDVHPVDVRRDMLRWRKQRIQKPVREGQISWPFGSRLLFRGFSVHRTWISGHEMRKIDI
jgi:hypothetical protein